MSAPSPHRAAQPAGPPPLAPPFARPMRALCVVQRDPFHPAAGREMRLIEAPCTLASVVPPLQAPHILLRNGQAVLRADWGQPVADGDLLAVVCLPQGGGGGSNPLRTVLTIGLLIATQGTFAAGLFAQGGALGALGLSAAQGGALLFAAGSLLVNALIPPPKAPSNLAAASLAAPSPTYNLQAQGNLARLDAAIPVQYDRIAGYPDLAAQPYQEFHGNEQYLYQLLCIGQGEHEIEALRIEDTPVENFDDISYQIVPPGGTITLFPAAVVTATEVAGAELQGARSATYSQSGTTITVSSTAHALSVGRTVRLVIGGVSTDHAVASAPTPDTFTVISATSATASGAATYGIYLGPYTAAAAGTQANTLGFDFVATRGLYAYNSSTGALTAKTIVLAIMWRQIDGLGAPVTGWFAAVESFTDATTTPQRYSRRYTVAPGRYEARVFRADAKDTATTSGHEMAWAGLRSYLQGGNAYGDVTLVAMRMRASNNLSGLASRKVNVIATRKLPVWNGSSWSAPQATRNPAWALADACRNSSYGAGLADARLDLPGLLALAAVWDSRGDRFDARFDSAITLWEALGKIANAGRARAFMQGGIVRVVRDAPQSLPVAMFTAANIRRGTLNIDYAVPSDTTPDCVDVGYFDETQWSPQRVMAVLPGGTQARPARLELFGVTGRSQAWREGLYHAAAHQRRRRTIRFDTEMDGLIPSLGDLIAVSHDMPAWGQSADAVAWNAATRVLTLDEPLSWGAGNHYAALRLRDGSLSGPHLVSPGASEHELILPDGAPTPDTGVARERTRVSFGPGQTWAQLARVTGVRPSSVDAVQIECVNEDPGVHSAESGLFPAPILSSQLATGYTAPVVLGLSMRSSSNEPGKALLSWQAAPGAEHYLIEMAPAQTGAAWTRVGETSTSNFAVGALYGANTWIRVAAYGRTRGPWVTVSFSTGADYMWTTDSAPWWTTDTALMWK